MVLTLAVVARTALGSQVADITIASTPSPHCEPRLQELGLDGSAYAAGYCSGAFVMRVDAQGLLAERLQFRPPGIARYEPGAWFSDLAALANGSVLLALWDRTIYTHRCRTYVWNLRDSPVDISPPSDDGAFCGKFVRGRDGELALTLSYSVGLGIQRLRSDGTTAWQRYFPGQGDPMFGRDFAGVFVPGALGKTYVLGSFAGVSSPRDRTRFVAVSAEGDVVTQRGNVLDSEGVFASLTERADGTLLATYYAPSDFGARGILHLNGEGAELGSITGGASEGLVGLSPLVDGDAFYLTDGYPGSSASFVIARFAQDLSLSWRTGLVLSSDERLMQIDLRTDGAIGALIGGSSSTVYRLVVVTRSGDVATSVPLTVPEGCSIATLRWRETTAVISGKCGVAGQWSPGVFVAQLSADGSIAWRTPAVDMPVDDTLTRVDPAADGVFASSWGIGRSPRHYALDGSIVGQLPALQADEYIAALSGTADGGGIQYVYQRTSQNPERYRSELRRFDAQGALRWIRPFDGVSFSPALQIRSTDFQLGMQTHGTDLPQPALVARIDDMGTTLLERDISAQMPGFFAGFGEELRRGVRVSTRAYGTDGPLLHQGIMDDAGDISDVVETRLLGMSSVDFSIRPLAGGGWVYTDAVQAGVPTLTRIDADGTQRWRVPFNVAPARAWVIGEFGPNVCVGLAFEMSGGTRCVRTADGSHVATVGTNLQDELLETNLADGGMLVATAQPNWPTSTTLLTLRRIDANGGERVLWRSERNFGGAPELTRLITGYHRAWIGLEAADMTGPVKARLIAVDLDPGLFVDSFE
jgi:hypothetical protein